MTGFGNFTYFYRKEDFSILRVVKVLFRLNLLAVALPYALDSTFQSYYFSPLVTLWFFLIYSTMHIYSEKNNKSDMVIYGKFIVLTIFVSILVANPSVFEFAVNTVARLTGSKWNAKEWLFRVALDRYIVICGMLFAFFLIKSKESSSFVRDYHWIAAPIATVAMLGYLWFCLSTDKFSYNKYHPFLSWIPVVAFIFLRNINEAFRKTTSSFFVYIGQISLETFIVQFHLWLALDTKGLLVVLPEHWWLNLLLTTIIFIYVSRLLSESTNAISEWLLEDSADFKFHTLIAVIAMIIFNYLPA
jgi:hypothetical protein